MCLLCHWFAAPELQEQRDPRERDAWTHLVFFSFRFCIHSLVSSPACVCAKDSSDIRPQTFSLQCFFWAESDEVVMALCSHACGVVVVEDPPPTPTRDPPTPPYIGMMWSRDGAGRSAFTLTKLTCFVCVFVSPFDKKLPGEKYRRVTPILCRPKTKIVQSFIWVVTPVYYNSGVVLLGIFIDEMCCGFVAVGFGAT